MAGPPRTVIDLPLDLYPTGTQPLGPVNVGGSADTFEFRIRCQDLPPDYVTAVRVDVEGSLNAGVDWEYLGFTAAGGEVRDRITGQPIVPTPDAVLTQTFSRAKPGNYRLRGTAQFFRDVTTEIKLTVS